MSQFNAKEEVNIEGNRVDTLTGKERRQRKREIRQGKKVLSKVDKVVERLNNIGDTLMSIGELKISGDFKATISQNITELFEFIATIDGQINAFNATTDVVQEDVVGEIRKNKRAWRQSNKALNKVEKTILTLSDIGDALEFIKTFELSEDDETKINTNITHILGSISKIGKTITENETVNIKTNDIEKLQPLIDYIGKLNDGISKFANADPASTEKNIDNYVRFVDKVNTVEVDKLKTASQMFEQMSKFSSSIKGDFNQLAESLGEKLLPVLTELKEVMSSVPEKLEVGFQQTSASIGAAKAPVTKKNLEAQTKRENPNLTPDELDKIVADRLKEAASQEVNGVSAKLDELITLLKGNRGQYAVFQTI
jgi:hypothetical protein